MPSHKTLYQEFCRTNHVPIQLQPWWLDAVCVAGDWEVCLSVDQQGQVLGAMPYYLTRRWGLRVIQQPPFSTYAGPWLKYPEQGALKPSNRIHFQKKVYADLIGQLPKVALFRQNFRPEVDNWLPFYWNGFRQTTRYTYILSAADSVHADTLLQSSTRNKIKQSAARFQVAAETDFDAYYKLLQHSYQRKGLALPMQYAPMKALHQTLQQHNSSTLLIARNKASGEPVAAYYLIHDKHSAGLLSSGQLMGPEFPQLNYRMIWECIIFCNQHNRSFDFEGSMDIGMEHVVRAFGARLTPYFEVWKTGNTILEIAFAAFRR